MLFSKRKKAVANPPSTHRYELPIEFRNQVIHIWTQSIGYSEAPFVARPAHYYEEELQATQQIHHVYASFTGISARNMESLAYLKASKPRDPVKHSGCSCRAPRPIGHSTQSS